MEAHIYVVPMASSSKDPEGSMELHAAKLVNLLRRSKHQSKLEMLTSLGSSCLDTLQANPFCADSSWVLWNATSQEVGSGYFCCLANQIGTQDMACDFVAAALPSTLTAQKVISKSCKCLP